MSKPGIKDSWIVKNIFSLINVGVLIAGLIAGYTKLQVTVEQLKQNAVTKEDVRKISSEVIADKIAPLQTDISYLKNQVFGIKNANDRISSRLNIKDNGDVEVVAKK